MTRQETAVDLLAHLPAPLAERVRPVADGPVPPSGEFVLYWMRTAARGHENPALDAALRTGAALDRPVFVYHALSERYPFASDRHHRFALEGARDAHRELAERGVGAAFHLERPGQRGPHLATLAKRAALVVTEDMPVEPTRTWTRRLVERTRTPIWCVDTACVLPMRLVGHAPTRAFRFREETAAQRADRLDRPWNEAPVTSAAFVPADLPFEPVDLARADLGALIATCEIDHGIGPVPDTVGGATAGYARWDAFKSAGLRQYAKRRNDAASDGVSRMSPYLRWGHVSPLRIAREAGAVGGDGAEKFLDELLVWRELAYAFCLHRDEIDTTAALPAWARATLADHRGDEREALYSWESLARGRTDDALWNAAQHSLLTHGELHNNLRMTWGKALLGWTADADEALALLLDLNHRYALDGRDPNSYGGILWCLGQFDRPFSPERRVLGSVRPRPTHEHVRRLDLARYRRKVERSPYAADGRPPRVAVIGAGLSGLACARTLQDHRCEVVVLDKARGPGGRMSTRRTDDGSFDHGAQYFTARDPRFRHVVRSWVEQGLVASWESPLAVIENGAIRQHHRHEQRYVGVPGMNALCRHVAADLAVRFERKTVALRPAERDSDRWLIEMEGGTVEGPFDLVLISAPAPQAATLVAAHSPTLAGAADAVSFAPCWAVLASFERGLGVEFDGAFVNGGPLSWIARNVSKPGRDASHETWVLHASPAWSRVALEESPERVSADLLAALSSALQVELPATRFVTAHRWRFALPETPRADGAFFDAQRGLGLCGDWCHGARVEGAWLSGVALAGRVLNELTERVRAAPPQPGSTAAQALLFGE